MASSGVRPRKKSLSRSVRKSRGSRQSSDGSSLKVATPSDKRLKYLADAGILVPEEIPSDEDSVPLDFTRLSNRGIGNLQSRYAVRHAHAIFNAAKLASDAANLKRELRFERAQFRLRHKEEKVNVVQAMMEDDEKIEALEDKLLEVEAKVGLLDAVAQGYAGIRDAASREITRRKEERAAID